MKATPTADQRQILEAKALILGVFVCLVVAKFVAWFPKDLGGRGLFEWVYTDWLIDYSAGFVRRGLAGQILRWLSPLIRPAAAISLAGWGIFGALTLAYLRSIRRSLDRLSPPLLVGLLFLPSLLPFYLYDHSAFARKETLGLLLVAWHLYLLEGCGHGQARVYLKKAVPLAVGALPVLLLMHESSLLLFVPIHALISEATLRRDAAQTFARRWLTLAILYSPAALTFCLIVRFGRPTFEMALAVYRHWVEVGALPPGAYTAPGQDRNWALPGSITGLPWTLSYAVSLTLSLKARALLEWLISLSVLGFSTVRLGCLATAALAQDGGADRSGFRVFEEPLARRFALRYFALPLLCSTPMYLLGWDLGRWFAVVCINYAIAALSRELVQAEQGAAAPPVAANPATTPGTDRKPVLSARFYLQLAALLVVVLFFRLPHAGIDTLRMFAEPVGDLVNGLLHTMTG